MVPLRENTVADVIRGVCVCVWGALLAKQGMTTCAVIRAGRCGHGAARLRPGAGSLYNNKDPTKNGSVRVQRP